MMRFSEVRHHDVVDVAQASTIGRVEALVVSADPARVAALRLAKSDHGDVLAWSELKAFGPDAVTVESTAAFASVEESQRALADPDRDLIGKAALSEGGDSLGTVTDAEFDPASGHLTTVRTDTQDLPAERLLGLGTYAAVFRTENPDASG